MVWGENCTKRRLRPLLRVGRRKPPGIRGSAQARSSTCVDLFEVSERMKKYIIKQFIPFELKYKDIAKNHRDLAATDYSLSDSPSDNGWTSFIKVFTISLSCSTSLFLKESYLLIVQIDVP